MDVMFHTFGKPEFDLNGAFRFVLRHAERSGPPRFRPDHRNSKMIIATGRSERPTLDGEAVRIALPYSVVAADRFRGLSSNDALKIVY